VFLCHFVHHKPHRDWPDLTSYNDCFEVRKGKESASIKGCCVLDFCTEKAERGAFDVICKEERANLLTATTDYGISSLTMGIGGEVQNYNINICNMIVHKFIFY